MKPSLQKKKSPPTTPTHLVMLKGAGVPQKLLSVSDPILLPLMAIFAKWWLLWPSLLSMMFPVTFQMMLPKVSMPEDPPVSVRD